MHEFVCQCIFEVAVGSVELYFTRETHAVSHCRWRTLRCTSCGAEYAYAQSITITSPVQDTRQNLQEAIDEVKDAHSQVCCPSCGAYEPETGEKAADDIADGKMKRVMYISTALILGTLMITVVGLLLSYKDVTVRNSIIDITLLFVALFSVPFFLSPLIKSCYTPHDINSTDLKEERLAFSDQTVLLRHQLESYAATLPDSQRAELSASTGWRL